MSSTRDSFTGLREEAGVVGMLKVQLKESQEMVQDLQKLVAINREAISLFADSNPSSKDALVKNLRAENTLLYSALKRAIEGQSKLEQRVDEVNSDWTV